MIAVSDTSPLNYLVLIELEDVLPRLFERILIPEAVHRELQDPRAPDLVRSFMASTPDWLEVRSVPDIDSGLRHLDSGEREVIALAIAVRADSVLLDERKGRATARDRGLAVSGTLGVLHAAAQRGFIHVSEALARLETTSFRVTPRLIRGIRQPE